MPREKGWPYPSRVHVDGVCVDGVEYTAPNPSGNSKLACTAKAVTGFQMHQAVIEKIKLLPESERVRLRKLEREYGQSLCYNAILASLMIDGGHIYNPGMTYEELEHRILNGTHKNTIPAPSPCGNPGHKDLEPVEPPEGLTPTQERVVRSTARIVVLHGARHSGKTHAAFAALEAQARRITQICHTRPVAYYAGPGSEPKPTYDLHTREYEQCRQILMAPNQQMAEHWLREYAHSLIRAGWSVNEYNKSESFSDPRVVDAASAGESRMQMVANRHGGNGSDNGTLIVTARSAVDGTNIIGSVAFHGGLTAVGSLDEVLRTKAYRHETNLNGLPRCVAQGGLIIIEVLSDTVSDGGGVEFIEFGEPL